MLTDFAFNAKQVVAITGITYRQLDYWTTTKLIAPSIANDKGSGNFRQFSSADLLHVLVINKLISVGFDVRYLRKISHRIRKVLGTTKRGDYLMVQSKWVLCLQWLEVAAHLANYGGPITAFPLDELKDQLIAGVSGGQ